MDVFDLVAKIRLDDSEYRDGVGKAQGTFSSLASGVGNGLATVAKVGAAAVSAGVAGVAALTKMGVEGFAQYEQLVGGVETLFAGTKQSYAEFYDSMKAEGKTLDEIHAKWFKVNEGRYTALENAANAYKTAGMSANQYMETVTSFSASLIQSLGGDTAKAAQVADMAITDMSDNANKMGTDISMIQNAYQGFAKQNYTMLDNLKLGYGGTKEEMQRLIDDANKVKKANGEMGKLSIESFADVAEAIHIMQTEMGITDTTAREAATTIEGSMSMMKAAWENLVVGMADEEQDLEMLVTNFVESTAIAAQNLIPRIEVTLNGIGMLIEKMAPIIAEALPKLVEAVLPALLTAGVSLITAIVKGVITTLPALYTALLDGVKIILVEVFGVSEAKAGEFANSVNSFFVKIKDGFLSLVKSAQTDGTFLNKVWSGLKDTGKAFCDFCVALYDALSAAFTWCVKETNTEGTVLNTIWKNIQITITTAIDVVKGVIKTFTAILKGDWSAAWTACKDTVKSVFDGCLSIVKNAVTLLKNALKFDWSLPKLKLPHISVSGGVAPYGIGGKGSLPKFSIEWYKKAYDNAMILRSPTIFGYSAASGKFLGGGDGNGNEIVAGESYLMNLIGNVVAERNGQIVELLSALLEATVDGNGEMVRALKEGQVITLNERELGRAVRGLA